jgi:hypothetical protein
MQEKGWKVTDMKFRAKQELVYDWVNSLLKNIQQVLDV